MLLNSMKDLHIDSSYGDFVFNGDIQQITDEKILESLIQERIKTNFGDFRLDMDNGADIDRFIGVDITNQLLDDIKISILNSLTYDGLLAPQDIVVLPMRIGMHRVYFRIIVQNPFGDKQEITTATLYNNEVMNND